MREDQMLRPCTLRQPAKIERITLAIIGRWRKSAALVGAHDGMDRRMHDDVSSFGQLLDLIRCRRRPWWYGHIVAGVAADHDAAGWRIHAIGYVAYDVRRPNGADLHIAGGPDKLWLVLGLKGDRIDQFCRAARRALLDLRVALGNLASVDECISDVHRELSAAYGETQRRNHVRTADGVDLWPGAIESPTQLHKVRKPLGVIIVHVREEDRIELRREHAEL